MTRHIYMRQIFSFNTHTYIYIYQFPWIMKKTRFLLIIEFDLEGDLLGNPIHGSYRANLSLHYCNLFEESGGYE